MSFHSVCKIVALTVLFTVTAADNAFAGAKLGDVFTNVLASWGSVNDIVSTIAWLAGAFLGVAGIFKFRDHVDNPQQTRLSEGVKRMLAGGMFLSLPFVIKSVQGSLFGAADLGDNQITMTDSTTATLSAGGLDKMVVDLMANIAGPAENLLTGFSYLAGIILIIVGISRLTKRMEEGPRGPAGAGTIMTFISAGALFSFADSMGTFANSMFGAGGQNLKMNPVIATDVIDDTDSREKIQVVIQAVMVFVTIVGYIAFIRGWFVLRAFADGQQGATVAQGLTFLFGGTLAINLGQLVNMIMNTVGVTGLSFA